jgi:hypothetical protein
VDFTREPIIETVITPKEGFKLVVRSSKNIGQEEHFVDALEVVSFGNAFFFRSTEKPKAFLVPVSDYEVLEVREARIVLKNVGTERAIKIGGGREAPPRPVKEPVERHEPAAATLAEVGQPAEASAAGEGGEAPKGEGRPERKRDRRRNHRRRRGGREEEAREAAAVPTEEQITEGGEVGEDKEGKIIIPPPAQGIEESVESMKAASSLLSSLLTPPPQLISETIERYKKDALFKGAFYESEEEGLVDVQEGIEEEQEEPVSPLTWEFSPEAEEPFSPFTPEESSENEPMEMPPDSQSHRE